MTDPAAVAAQLRDAYARQTLVPQPTATDPAFDLAAGYAVERETFGVCAPLSELPRSF